MYGLKSDYPLQPAGHYPQRGGLGSLCRTGDPDCHGSFSIPDGLDEVFLWDAMLAKQYLTIAQGYFQTGTRYCAVNTAAHGRMLDESKKYYQKGKELFLKLGNDASASEVDRLLTLIEAIRTNADYGLAKLQFDEYYSINYKIMKSCICLEDGFDDQYKCVTLK